MYSVVSVCLFKVDATKGALVVGLHLIKLKWLE